MAEKKVGITGKVEIEGQATQDLQALNAELTEFKSQMDRANQGILKILQALAFMAKGMSGASTDAKEAAAATATMADEQKQAAAAAEDLSQAAGEISAATDDAADSSEDLAKGFENAEQAADQADKSTGRLSGTTEILRGFLQRIGHKVFDGLLSGLKSLTSYLLMNIEKAGELDAVFDKMASRGVKNVVKLRNAVGEAAGALGIDQLDLAKSVNLAESLGAGEAAVEAATTAWQNYRLTGMDVNRQIEVSTRIVRAFNLPVSELADVINDVAAASQSAKVSQETMWNGLSSMGPKVKQLGGTYEDLIKFTNAAIAAGIKVEEEGPQGANELFDALIASSSDFGQKLVELGVISTKTSPQWKQLRDDVNSQKTAFEDLNKQISDYKREATEIGLLVGSSEKLIDTYTKLSEKKASGARLNKLERDELRASRQAIQEANQELSKYDETGLIVVDREFKRLDVVEQLRLRMDAATAAQANLNVESQKAELIASDMNTELQNSEAQFTTLTSTLQSEVPAAIQAAISGEGGLPAFIQQLSQVPGALDGLPASVQTLITAIGPAMATASTTMATGVTSIQTQFQSMVQGGTESMNTLKTNISNLMVALMGPVSEAVNQIAQMISNKLREPFGEEGNKSLYQMITEWSSRVAAYVVADFESIANGDASLSDILKIWFRAALDKVAELWAEFGEPMLASLQKTLEDNMPAFREWLIHQFVELAQAAGNAFGSAIAGFLDEHVGGAGDWWMNALGVNAQTAVPGKLDLSGRAEAAVNNGYSSASNSTYNINVNGVGDPNAVTAKTMQAISQQDRLGNRDSRLR